MRISYGFRPALLLPALWVGTTWMSPPAWTGPIYQVRDLGSLGGDSVAFTVNSGGMAAGTAKDASGRRHAVSYFGSQLADLGLPGDAVEAQAHGINRAGQIVGTTYGGGRAEATLWSGSGSSQKLGTLGGQDSYGMDVNNRGQVVGGSATAGGEGHAFLYENGRMRDLGGLQSGWWSAAYSINDHGQVAGYGWVGAGSFRGFVWSEETGMVMLSTLGGRLSYAMDINNRGQVVGHAAIPSGSLHAVLWQNGQVQDLGTLGGTNSYAYAINDSGAVVGFSWRNNASTTHAFLYVDGVMFDLNRLLGFDSGWELQEAYDINNNGQIVGAGLFQGERRAFLLDPLRQDAPGAQTPLIHNPEPSTLLLLGTGCAVLLRMHRKRAKRAKSCEAVP